MKKLILLMSLLLVLASSVISAQVTYTGYMTPTPIVTNSSIELVSNAGTDYYVTFSEDTLRAGLYNVATGTVTTASTPFNIDANTYHWSFQDSTNYIVFYKPTIIYDGLYSFVQLATTSSGTFSGKTVYNATVLGNKYNSSTMINANQTHFKSTDTNNYAFDTPLIGDIFDIDSFNDNIVVIDHSRNIYEYTTTGALINKGEIKTTDVPEDITGMFTYEDRVYITTRTTIYEFIFSKYYIINGENYDTTQCIDDYSLSNNTQFIEQDGEIQFWTGIDDVTRCNGVCVDVTKVDEENLTYKTGECEDTGCTNECLFNGYQSCDSITSYTKCVKSTTSDCLIEIKNIECLTNQKCTITGSENYGECKDINYSEYGEILDYPNFFLTPYTENKDNTIYNKDTQGRVIVDTKNSIHTQYFTLQTLSVGTSLYTAKNCDYKQKVLFNDELINTDLTQSGWLPDYYNVITKDGDRYINLNDSSELKKLYSITNNNPLITTSFIMNIDNNTNNSILLLKQGNNIVTGSFLRITRSLNNKSLTFSEYNNSGLSSVLLIDTSTNTYDDLDKVTLSTRFNFATYNYDYYITITRSGLDKNYQFTPLKMLNTLNSVDRISYTMINGSLLINYVKAETDATLDNYRLATLGNNAVNCQYTQTGCYTPRVYVGGNDVNVYNNYEDSVICVNSLKNSVVKTSDSKGFNTMVSNMSFGARILTVLIALLLTFLIVIIPSVMLEIKSSVLILSVLTLFIGGELILFTVIGLLPSWILFILMVLVGGIIAVTSRRVVMGD